MYLTSFEVGDFVDRRRRSFSSGREGGLTFVFLRRKTRAAGRGKAEHLGDHLGLHMGRGEWLALLPTYEQARLALVILP